MNQESRTFEGQKDRYEEVGYLGGGQTADVYRVRRLSDHSEWALKLLRTPEYHRRFFDEVTTLYDLTRALRMTFPHHNSHSLVPEVIDSYDGTDKAFLVMTLAEGQPLDELLREQGRLSESDALTILVQVTRVFQVLHEALHRSYLDFQPRNIFTFRQDAKLQTIVIDWNLLSGEGQQDVPGDILTLGQLFYRMVVGIPLPKRGVTAGPAWQTVTLGTQKIIRQATHRNLTYRYHQIQELRSACEAQLALWEQPAYHLIDEVSSLLNDTKSALLDAPENRPRFTKAHMIMQILNLRASELPPAVKSELPTYQAQITAGWQVGTLLTTGKRFLDVPDLDQAEHCFQELYDSSDDLDEKLRALRWLLVAKTLDANNRALMRKACERLDDNQPEAALTVLNDGTPARGHDTLATLRHSVAAQVEWLAAQSLIERAVTQQTVDLYQQAEAKVALVQSHVDKLPAAHQQLLTDLWGDLAQQQQSLVEKAQALERRSANIEELRDTLQSATPTTVVERLQQEIDKRPDDAGLVALALELAQQWLHDLADERQPPTVAATAQQLLDVMLPHAGPNRRHDLLRERRAAAAVAQLQTLVEEGSLEPQRVEQLLQRLITSGNQPTLARLLPYINNQLMQWAEATCDLALARVVAEVTQRAGGDGTSILSRRAEKIAETIRDELTQRRQDLYNHIAYLSSQTDSASLDEALRLVTRLLSEGDHTWERQNWLREQHKNLTDQQNEMAWHKDAEAQKENLREQGRALITQANDTDDPAKLDELASQLINLAETAQHQQFPELVNEYRKFNKDWRIRSERLRTLEPDLVKVEQLFQEYERLAASQLPALRTARLAVLEEARQPLAPLAADLAISNRLKLLHNKVETARQNEGADNAEHHTNAKQSRAEPELQQLPTQTPRVDRQPEDNIGYYLDQVTPGARRSERWWLPALLVALIVLVLVGISITWLQSSTITTALGDFQMRTSQDAENLGLLVSSALGKMSTPVAGLPTQIAALTTQMDTLAAPQSTITVATQLDALVAPLADLPGQVGQLQSSVAGMQTAVAALGTRSAEVTSTIVLAPTPDVEATLAVLRAPLEAIATTQAATATAITATVEALNATATAQIEQTTTMTATIQALTTRVTGLEATITALAVTPTPATTETPATEETTAETVPDPAIEESQATTDTSNIPPSNPPLSITFPISGAELYIAPWVVEVSARAEVSETVAYRLLLNSTVLVDSFTPVAGQTTGVYTRTITGDFDDFPGLSQADRDSLGLAERNQLPPGRYTLRIESLADGSPLHQIEFVIRDDPPLAFHRVELPIVRRPEPSDQQERIDQRALLSGDRALILGKAPGPYEGQPNLWCYWEATEDPRRGWTLCQYLSLVDGGQRADQVTTIPDLLPALAAQ